MRAFRKSWIGIGLAILFAASLFFFRGSQRYSNLFNSNNVVANISGTPISTTKFLRSMDMNINQFSQMIGSKLTGDQIRSFQVHQIALQNLVNNAIFEHEFDKINFILSIGTQVIVYIILIVVSSILFLKRTSNQRPCFVITQVSLLWLS